MQKTFKKCAQKVQPQKPWPRKMQKQFKINAIKNAKKCNFWKFVFVKHAHFQNLHFFRIFFWHLFRILFGIFFSRIFCILPRFFCNFWKIWSPNKTTSKKCKKMQIAFVSFFLVFFRIFSNVFFGHVFAVFLLFFCILPSFFCNFRKIWSPNKTTSNCFFFAFLFAFFFAFLFAFFCIFLHLYLAVALFCIFGLHFLHFFAFFQVLDFLE